MTTVSFRRKREEKTNYGRRLKLIESGEHRMVVRRTNKNVITQIVKFNEEGDKIIVSAHTNELKKYGWKCARCNIPAAYLVGLLCGLKAKKAGVENAILDIGMHPPVKGSVIFAALKGAVDAGLNIPHSEEAIPSEDRIAGKHIASNNVTKFTKFDPKEVTKNFTEVKNKLLKGV